MSIYECLSFFWYLFLPGDEGVWKKKNWLPYGLPLHVRELIYNKILQRWISLYNHVVVCKLLGFNPLPSLIKKLHYYLKKKLFKGN